MSLSRLQTLLIAFVVLVGLGGGVLYLSTVGIATATITVSGADWANGSFNTVWREQDGLALWPELDPAVTWTGTAPGEGTVVDLAIDDDGRLYVATSKDVVHRLDPGNGGDAEGITQLMAMDQLATDDNGVLYGVREQNERRSFEPVYGTGPMEWMTNRTISWWVERVEGDDVTWSHYGTTTIDHIGPDTLHGPFIRGMAVGTNGTVYLALLDGTVRRVTRDGDTIIYNGSTRQNDVVVEDGVIYVASGDGAVRKLSADGSVDWEHTTGDDTAQADTVTVGRNGDVYASYGSPWGNVSTLVRLAPNGDRRWRVADHTGRISRAVVDDNGHVYIAASDRSMERDGDDVTFGRNYTIRRVNRDGTTEWRHPVDDRPAALAVDDAVYAAWPDGRLQTIIQEQVGYKTDGTYNATTYTADYDLNPAWADVAWTRATVSTRLNGGNISFRVNGSGRLSKTTPRTLADGTTTVALDGTDATATFDATIHGNGTHTPRITEVTLDARERVDPGAFVSHLLRRIKLLFGAFPRVTDPAEAMVLNASMLPGDYTVAGEQNITAAQVDIVGPDMFIDGYGIVLFDDPARRQVTHDVFILDPAVIHNVSVAGTDAFQDKQPQPISLFDEPLAPGVKRVNAWETTVFGADMVYVEFTKKNVYTLITVRDDSLDHDHVRTIARTAAGRID